MCIRDRSTGILFMDLQNCKSCWAVSSLVFTAFTTSTNFIICAGLKKCKPAILSGCGRAFCMEAMEREEVLLANIVCWQLPKASCWKSSIFISSFSTIASITNCVLQSLTAVSYTHLRAHETVLDLVCRLLLEKKKKQIIIIAIYLIIIQYLN